MSTRTLAAAFAVLSAFGIAGCADTDAGPTVPATPPGDAEFAAVWFWDANAAANWTELTTSLASRRAVNVARLYAYLSLAQFRAAEAAGAIRPHPPTSAAIGAASAVVLSAYFPEDVTEIDAFLDAQRIANPWPGAKHQDFAAGEAIGRATADRVLEWSQDDRVGLADPGTPPIGPGFWVWTGGPIARSLFGARPFFLASSDEFRSPPPPAFGSAEFLDALAEVRQFSDTRTPAQLALAVYWNTNLSPTSSAAINDLAVELIREYRRKDTDAARILFLMNAALFDSLIGCFDAKYHYWFIRPPQADPAITTPLGLPPHPSYPAAHSCAASAAMEVLARSFPSERTRVDQLADESGLSRIYAGIHYRFDTDAGLELGRSVAAKAVAANLDHVAVK